MKKITKLTLSILLCLTMVLGCTGCDPSAIGDAVKSLADSISSDKSPNTASGVINDNKNYSALQENQEHKTAYYEKIKLNYGYNALQTNGQRELYDDLSENIYSVSDETNENQKYNFPKLYLDGTTLSESDIRVVMEAFACDHPQVFWLANLFGYYSDNNGTAIQMYSEYSPQDVTSGIKALDNAINNILAHVPADLNQFDRELYIHDIIVNNCVYAEDVKTFDADKAAFSVYGVFINNSAVCEGYAKAMQYLLSCVGIESITVNGRSNDELHKWNIVNIDNEWYHLDATWDDNDEYVVYNYFNVDEKTIKSDHYISTNYTQMTDEEICNANTTDTEFFNLDTPQCTSMTDNFYNVKGATFYGFNDKTETIITAALYNAAQNGEKNLYIRLDNSLDFNSTVQQLFYESPYKFFDYVYEVNSEISGVTLGNSVSMITNENQRTIQVVLSYE